MSAEPRSPDARPRVVAGLRLLARVGHGGEGEVWEARDAEGRRRALKLVRPEVLAAPDELARRGAFLRRIDHPALVRVHRTGRLTGSSLDGWGFVEMDFIEGEPLARAPADPDALARLEPLAEALDALHEGTWSDGVPLVHRDVKPANLIARPDGEVVLVDCSTLRGTDATQLTRVGTPLYAAPEVVTGRVGPPADVYSFAATIVALATGARGDALAEVLAGPEELDLPETVGRALAPDPAARPRSCRAVLEAGTAIDLDDLPDLRMGQEAIAWSGPGAQPNDEEGDWYAPAEGDWYAPAEGDWSAPAEGDWDAPAEGDWYAPAEGDWSAPAEGPDVAALGRAGPVTPWLAGLLAVVVAAAAAVWGMRTGGALPGGAVPGGAGSAWPVIAAVAAGALHIVLARAAGQPWLTVLLAPPVAWAWLLGARAAPAGRVRAWVRTALVGLLAAGTVGVLAGMTAVGPLGEPVPVLTAVPLGLLALPATALLTPLVVAAADAGGVTGPFIRLVLSPVWLLGAVLLVTAGLVALAGTLAGGRGWRGAGLLVGTLSGAGALLSSRPASIMRRGADPRA